MKSLATLFLLGVVPLHAAALSPDDFAFGYPLGTDQQTSIYRLNLPAKVYSEVTRTDLGDLRVFNAAHEAVPHTLRRPESTQDEERAPEAIPFFPLETQAPDGKDRVAVQMHSDAHGSIINIDSGAFLRGGRVVRAYLLDCASQTQIPSQLELTWTGGADSRVLPINVSSSDDLSHWTPRASATLLRLTYAGHRLEQRRIDLPSGHYKYLRLSWPGDAPVVTLSGVQAHFPRNEAKRVYQWLEIEGYGANEKKPIYDFDTHGSLPVERVDLALAENNSLVEGVLYSRANATALWTQRYRGVFYRLHEQKMELRNEPVSLKINNDRYWRLEVTSDPAGFGIRPPRLRLAWVPDELFFLARGSGPFTLAVGSGTTTAQNDAVNFLLPRIDSDKRGAFIGTAIPGIRVILGGSRQLQQESPFPWQRFVLWAVLVRVWHCWSRWHGACMGK